MITHDEGKNLRHGNAEDEEEVEKSNGCNRVHHHLHPIYFLPCWRLNFLSKSFYIITSKICTTKLTHTCNHLVVGIYQQTSPYILIWRNSFYPPLPHFVYAQIFWCVWGFGCNQQTRWKKLQDNIFWYSLKIFWILFCTITVKHKFLILHLCIQLH